jgi:GT2 family glycosyltransferase
VKGAGARAGAAAGSADGASGGGPGLAYAGDSPELSLVVPTWEGSEPWLRDCLRGVAAQQRSDGLAPLSAELLVVLDGPAPRVEASVRGIAPAARIVRLPERRGFAAAASAGLRAARGALVALLNDDAVPEPGWLAALRDAAAREPDAGSFASLVLQAADPARIDSAGHGLTRWGEAFALGHGARAGAAPWDREAWVFGAPASAAMYRRALLLDCGAFDSGMLAYLEDVDLSLRAQLLGFPCLFVQSARVLHRGSASYGEGASIRLVARNRWRLLAKSMPRNVLRAAAPAALASVAAELAQRGLRMKEVPAALAGHWDGLRSAPDAFRARPTALGGRRSGDAALFALLRDSEERLLETLAASDDPAGKPPRTRASRRARAALVRSLRAWVDSRQACVEGCSTAPGGAASPGASA